MEGTNYIDHRLPCTDMISHIIVGENGIGLFDLYGRLLYVWIKD